MSAEAIADYLNNLSVPTKYKILNRKLITSGYWYPSRILSMLHNTVYYGVHILAKCLNIKNQKSLNKLIRPLWI